MITIYFPHSYAQVARSTNMVQTAEPHFVVLRKPFQLSAVEKAFRERWKIRNGNTGRTSAAIFEAAGVDG